MPYITLNKQQLGKYCNARRIRENIPITPHHTPDVNSITTATTGTDRTEAQTNARRLMQRHPTSSWLWCLLYFPFLKVTPPTLQWRAKSPIADQEAMPQRRHSCSPRPSLGQNLNITDFPPLTTIQEKEHSNNVATRRSPISQWRAISTTPDQEATSRHRRSHSPRAGGEVNLGMDVLPQPRGLPTLESVMEELNESTLQYLNVEDPVERAARQKRVLQTEIDGTVEETTARILRNSTTNALADAGLAASHTTEPTPQVPPSDTKAVKPVPRRGRPVRINTSRTTIRLSPKTYAGMGSRKRKLAQSFNSKETINNLKQSLETAMSDPNGDDSLLASLNAKLRLAYKEEEEFLRQRRARNRMSVVGVKFGHDGINV
ncbi:hypothetical protein F2Q69_00048521 [Brassica cretica]|uniref:Uncharacterized protein n=1 Tax=Brassica cretica TaxID=69181 RepID=A0A8S9PZD8_BRACR|nr:hypothetical protein F2Q69_00048521 [Brassica cretica]